MTYLSWDESRPCVLACQGSSRALPTVKPGHQGRARRRTRRWRIPNEFYQLFPPCHGRAGPGSRDFVGLRQCRWRSRRRRRLPRQRTGDASARRAGNTRSGAERRPGTEPGTGGKPFGRAHRSARGRGDPGDTTAGDRAGSDRRSVRRGNHAGAENGRHRQGQRQLGFGVRHPDRFLQVAVGAARQAGHQADQAIR